MVPGCGAAYFDFFNPRVSAVAASQYVSLLVC
jgi:hypothetical protein